MALIPKDLQRFSIDGPNVTPQYIKPTPAVSQLVEQILDCFRFGVDDTYGNLQDALESIALASQRHRLIHGIIHVLEDRLQFQESLAVDPIELRKSLFQKAAKIQAPQFSNLQWRSDILAQVADEYHLDMANIEDFLYADLKSERKITQFEDIDSENAIAEYNLALAKSLLLYARTLTFTIDLTGDSSAISLRKLFQSLKFFNLLFQTHAITETAWQFTVDGPSAVLPQPQKYATSLAAFLPTLYMFQNWHATSNIEIDGKPYTWQLKPDDFTPPQIRFAQRLPQEAETLAARIQEIAPEWIVNYDTPILNLGPQAVWIPDFSITNCNSKKSAHIEILGYWRADYLNRRLENLKNAPKNLILVLSDKLKIDAHKLAQTNVQIIFFKITPKAKDIVKIAENFSE